MLYLYAAAGGVSQNILTHIRFWRERHVRGVGRLLMESVPRRFCCEKTLPTTKKRASMRPEVLRTET